MPLRSVKMYGFIFGFQRRVWWPKCTPASSRFFMETDMVVPPFSVVPPPASSPAATGSTPAPRAGSTGVCDEERGVGYHTPAMKTRSARSGRGEVPAARRAHEVCRVPARELGVGDELQGELALARRAPVPLLERRVLDEGFDVSPVALDVNAEGRRAVLAVALGSAERERDFGGHVHGAGLVLDEVVAGAEGDGFLYGRLL